jgi:hypothetical protein
MDRCKHTVRAVELHNEGTAHNSATIRARMETLLSLEDLERE